jgi:pimeloyl-ACP methyl ester carboxylesterase
MRVFHYQQRPVHYLETGRGKTVVLLHGFAEDHRVWNQQVAALQPFYRLIVPDLPGSGLSAPPGEAPEVSIEQYADAVAALMRHEQTGGCTVLGHSMGGYIMLALAERHPDLVEAMGLVHSTALPDTEEKKINRQRGIELIGQYGGYNFIKNTTPNLFSAQYKAQHADKIAELIERGRSFSDKALQQYYYAMMQRPSRTGVLSGSGKPVLFIIGTEDVAAPLKDVLPQTYLPACSYIHILDNVGHMGMWEAAEKVNTAIKNFVH